MSSDRYEYRPSLIRKLEVWWNCKSIIDSLTNAPSGSRQTSTSARSRSQGNRTRRANAKRGSSKSWFIILVVIVVICIVLVLVIALILVLALPSKTTTCSPEGPRPETCGPITPGERRGFCLAVGQGARSEYESRDGGQVEWWEDTCGMRAAEPFAKYIVYGTRANKGEFPWYTHLHVERNSHSSTYTSCGGALLNDRSVSFWLNFPLKIFWSNFFEPIIYPKG